VSACRGVGKLHATIRVGTNAEEDLFGQRPRRGKNRTKTEIAGPEKKTNKKTSKNTGTKSARTTPHVFGTHLKIYGLKKEQLKAAAHINGGQAQMTRAGGSYSGTTHEVTIRDQDGRAASYLLTLTQVAKRRRPVHHVTLYMAGCAGGKNVIPGDHPGIRDRGCGWQLNGKVETGSSNLACHFHEPTSVRIPPAGPWVNTAACPGAWHSMK